MAGCIPERELTASLWWTTCSIFSWTSLCYSVERGWENISPAILTGGPRWERKKITRADVTRTTSGVWLKCTKIAFFSSLFNCETQSMLFNDNVVNEVVKHVAFIEYQLYRETGTRFTSSFIWLISSKHAQPSDSARSLKNFPMALESIPSEQLNVPSERQILKL